MERLASLSTSLLDVSGIQSGDIGLQLQPADVSNTVRISAERDGPAPSRLATLPVRGILA